MTPAHWARLRAKTEEEVMAAALSDPDAQPRTKAQLARMRRVSRAKFIRQRLGMSQDTFSETFRIPLGTLRDWEQHRREPDQAARAYLEVIARAPDTVRKALAEAREPALAG
jgi:putative transcriptional regulator